MKSGKTVFVTVGTTLFDPLIDCVTDSVFLNVIARLGYDNLILQFGKGQIPELTKTSGGNASSTDENIHDGIYSGKYSYKPPTLNGTLTINWEIYRFKSSLEEDMKNADLIISHAGAGSVMEGLEHCRSQNVDLSQKQNNTKETVNPEQYKKLVVVINDKLMNNHQCELAYALEKRNFLFVLAKPEFLLEQDKVDTIVKKFRPKSFEGGNDASFGTVVDDFMGYK